MCTGCSQPLRSMCSSLPLYTVFIIVGYDYEKVVRRISLYGTADSSMDFRLDHSSDITHKASCYIRSPIAQAAVFFKWRVEWHLYKCDATCKRWVSHRPQMVLELEADCFQCKGGGGS